MAIWYSVDKEGAHSRSVYCVPGHDHLSVPDDEDIEADTELMFEAAADDFHRNHDGWERSWPLTISLHRTEHGPAVARCEVTRESEPVFYCGSVERVGEVPTSAPSPTQETSSRKDTATVSGRYPTEESSLPRYFIVAWVGENGYLYCSVVYMGMAMMPSNRNPEVAQQVYLMGTSTPTPPDQIPLWVSDRKELTTLDFLIRRLESGEHDGSGWKVDL